MRTIGSASDHAALFLAAFIVPLLLVTPGMADTPDAIVVNPTGSAPACTSAGEPFDWRLHPDHFRAGALLNQPETSMVAVPPCPQLDMCAQVCRSGGRCESGGLASNESLGISQCSLGAGAVFSCTAGQIHKVTYDCACPDGSACSRKSILLLCG